MLPPSTHTYTLKQADGAVNFAYTSLKPGDVRSLYTNLLRTGFGTSGNAAADSSPTAQITAGGVTLNTTWLQASNTIIMLEGRSFTTNPLVLEISKSGSLIGSWTMGMSISSVSNMFRYLNVRTNDTYFTTDAPVVHAIAGRWDTNLSEPANYPDGFYNPSGATLKTVIAVHGLDWDESETPGGHSEIFKRFFQSGLNARFIGVSWASNIGRRLGAPVDYDKDVIGAFVAARYVKDGLASFCGPNTSVFAHSLANMLVSSAIEDYGMSVGQYFMVNAAVPAEAYDGRSSITTSDQLAMIPVEWKNAAIPAFSYGTNVMCAGWSTLFTAADPRSALTWDGRFKDVPNRTTLWQFYSTGEEILRGSDGVVPTLAHTVDFWDWWDYDTVVAKERVWVYNEMTKGTLGIGSWLVDYHDQAGWAFNTAWYTNGVVMTPDAAALLAITNLIATNFFKPFDSTDSKVPNWNNGSDWLYRPNGDTGVLARLPFIPFGSTNMSLIKNHAKIMAESMPPLSGAAGFFPLVVLNNTVPNRRFDMNNPPFKNASLWPTSRPEKTPDQVNGKRWLHGDYKDPAYLYNHGIYDKIAGAVN